MASSAKTVSFEGVNSTIIGSGVEDTSDNNDSDEEFYEITTSEGESFVTSDEEDAEFLQVALENAYTCSPLKQTRDPAEMSSYLLLDKDFCEDDDLDHESVISEISMCASGVGCGTTTSDDEEEGLPPRKKRRKTRSTAAVSTDRGNQSRKQDDKDDEQTQGNGKGRKKPQRKGKAKEDSGSKTQQKGKGKGQKSQEKESGVTNDGQRKKSVDDYVKWELEPVMTSVERQPKPKELLEFLHFQGTSPRTKTAKTALEVFQLFFTSAILTHIVNETTKFASQKGKTMEFCNSELMAFIGINIAMGMLHLPQVQDYWSTNVILATPWFPGIMSRNRFYTVLRYLHLADSKFQVPKGKEGYNPLFKVQFLIDHLTAVYPQYYYPSRYLSIDEMMVGTRCRISFLQYLPKKPTKFGIKVWINAEAKSGYVLSFQIYTGSDTKTKEKGLGHRVVMDLMQPYFFKNHCLFVDNFYTSVELLVDLLDKGTYCVGTARTNRKHFPTDIIPAKDNVTSPGNFRFATGTRCSKSTEATTTTTVMKADLLSVSCSAMSSTATVPLEPSPPEVSTTESQGVHCAAGQSDDKIIALWWKDRRDVLALTTMHNTSASVIMKRRKGSHDKQPLPCPTAIIDYNQYMGGVDLMDQHLSYYSLTTRRTLKWWKKIFWRLVDISVVNSWIIFRHNNPESDIKSHREFRLKLVDQLVQPLLDLRASPDCPKYLLDTRGRHAEGSDMRLLGKHFAYKGRKRGRCVVCYSDISPTTKKKKDTKTQSYCKKCDVYLCVGRCFEIYHTRSTY